MLLGGSAAVAVREARIFYGIDVLNTVSLVLILGSALLVSGAVVYSSVTAPGRSRGHDTRAGLD